ncbi:hypothetical protein F5884DRAFT_742654 [Xylogone sp. PMI_703]|nr:hypothetical protein F5884DRAFT_742654 [Xylogone sp. PMI_703]
MSPAQPVNSAVANSRKRQIPGTLVLNWQSIENPATRSLVRRPMTACGACRAAKVKCNGQRRCERCRSRDLHCTYTTPANTSEMGNGSAGAKTSPVVSQVTSSASSLSTSQMPPDGICIDSPCDAADPVRIDGGGTSPLASHDSTMDYWSEEMFNQALDQFDWTFPELDTSLNIQASHGSGFLPSLEQTTFSPRNAPQSDVAVPSQQVQPSSGNCRCQCRINMILLIPKLECAMQEKPKPQLDKLFKVTVEVIRSCQQSAGCGCCHMRPVDLVCIMTIFEQTAACFSHIVKSGFDQDVKVGFGSYSVMLSDDTKLKRMLVLDLVEQANTLLDSMSNLAQNSFVSQSGPVNQQMNRSPAWMNQLNLDYVREVIEGFRKLFRLITEFFDGKNPDTGFRPRSMAELQGACMEPPTVHDHISPNLSNHAPPAPGMQGSLDSQESNSTMNSFEQSISTTNMHNPLNLSFLPSLPYPCIGVFRFLDFGASLNPVYPEVLSRIRAGETFLDLGCCFGQDIRKLTNDGAPSENLLAADSEGRFIELGYDLFKDRETLKARFYTQNIFDEEFLPEWHGKVDIIYVGAFLHLFNFEKQQFVVAQLVKLLRKRKGSLVFGRNIAADNAGDFHLDEFDVFRHNQSTIRELWEQTHEGKWEVSSEVTRYESEGWDNKYRGWEGGETKEMKFIARRL